MENTAPKFFCFVLMPFEEKFDDVYSYGIKESCKESDAYCERVDEQTFQGTILQRIYNQISKADLIIADMTGKSPNVFYEVGYAHALNKPTVLLTQKAEDIPFDLRHYPHIIYNGKISVIRQELVKKISWFKENNETGSKPYKNEIEIVVDGKKLSGLETTFEFEDDWRGLVFTVHNNSFRRYREDEYQIGLLTDEWDFEEWPSKPAIYIPEKKFLYILSPTSLLLPGSYLQYYFRKSSKVDLKKEYTITFRIFTDIGSRDFSLKLVKKAEVSENECQPVSAFEG